MTRRFILILVACLTSPLMGQSPDACGLLSRLEVEDAAGIRVREGAPRLRSGNLTSCWFAGEDPGQVAILVRRLPSADWVSEQVARMRRGAEFGTYREMAGIGDRAFLYTTQKGGGVMCVFGREYYLQVSLYRSGEDSSTPAVLEKLARSALARLKPVLLPPHHDLDRL
jgi:hypothetical protein